MPCGSAMHTSRARLSRSLKTLSLLADQENSKIWDYEDTMAGELSRLTVEEHHGYFALHGKGFWSTNLDFNYNGDKRDGSLRLGGPLVEMLRTMSFDLFGVRHGVSALG